MELIFSVKNIQEIINELLKSDQIILWGYDFLGKRVDSYLRSQGIKVDYYWDSNIDKIEKSANKNNFALPCTKGNKDAKIIICIGNNVLREKLSIDIQKQGYIHVMNEAELHVLFKQVLNDEYPCINSDNIRHTSHTDRLKMAVSYAVKSNYKMWERQFEYVERLRIASKIIVVGKYVEAVFCKSYMYTCNGIKNIVAYIDGAETGEEKEIKHINTSQLDPDAIYIVMRRKYFEYLDGAKISWYCEFSELIQNVFTAKHSSEFFLEEVQKILDAYFLLEDEESREIYVESICNKIAPQFATKVFGELQSDGEYFNHGIFQLGEEECYVDAGAYNGDTVVKFIQSVNNKYKKVYAFELDKDCYEMMNKNLEKYNDERIKLFCMGLYKQTKTISIGGYLEGRYIEDTVTRITDTGKVVALDDILKNEQVTFIKMDIEGSELEALEGAKEILCNQKPKLAISAYHKLEDIWQIPLYLNSLNPEYHFYLRHHQPNAWDTDLYVK